MLNDIIIPEREGFGRNSLMLDALNKAIEIFASSGVGEKTPGGVLSDIIRPAADAAGADLVSVFRSMNDTGEVLSFKLIYSWEKTAAVFAPSDGESDATDAVDILVSERGAAVLSGGGELHIPISGSSDADDRAFEMTGLKSGVLIPVFDGGKLWGAVCFGGRDSDMRFDGGTAAFLRSVARLCADFIIRDEKARIYCEAELSSERNLNGLKAVLNNLDAIILATVPETGEILFINDKNKAFFDVKGDGTGELCYKFLHGRTERCSYCPYYQLEKAPESVVQWEPYDSYIDQTHRMMAQIIDWPGGQKAHLEFGIDVTEAKRAQKALLRRERMLGALNRAAIIFLARKEETYKKVMTEGVGIIAGAARIDRMSVSRNINKPDGLYASQIYRWSKEAGSAVDERSELKDNSYDRHIPRWRDILKSGEHINGPTRLMPEAGALSQFGCLSALAIPVFNEGAFWGFVLFEDLTEERSFTDDEVDILRLASFMLANVVIRNEEAKKIREANEHSKLMFDAIPLSCTLWNSNHEVIDCNDAIVKLFEVRDKEEFSERFLDCCAEYQPDGQRPEDKRSEVLNKAFNEGYHQFECMHRTLSGEPIPSEVTLIRVKHRSDYVVAGYIRDLREQKRMTQEIERQNILLHEALAGAQSANRAKSEFLSRMSHEMRTPMNAIVGMTNIAQGTDDIDKKNSCLDKIDGASKHLLSVINDVLDMSKIEANKFELSPNPFNFEKMISGVINVLNFRIEEKNLSLTVGIDPKIPLYVVCDEFRLTQIITNLLTNAVKFTPEGGNVSLNAKFLKESENGSDILVEVIDTGIGIFEEQQRRLFIAFEQADGGIARKFGGTGLGLAISKHIVELMGGNIWVESQPGRGAKFSFTVTLQICDDAENCGGQTERAEIESDGLTDVSYKKSCILIAEDVEINREVIAALLEDTGVRIDFAENGLEAVKMFEADPGRYGLILMDIQMPEMDGYEATRRIRSLNCREAALTPIVAMTANVFKEDIDDCLAAGMNAHLGKPIDVGVLHEKLKQYLL